MFFKRAAEGNNKFIHYVSGIVLTLFGIVLGQIPLTVVLIALLGSDGLNDTSDLFNLGIDQNLVLFLMILTFAGGLGALILAVKHIHKRSPKTLITGLDKINWKKMFFAFFLWLGLTMVLEVGNYVISPGDYVYNPPKLSYVILVLIALVFLPLQTTYEEVFFRGYLMQGAGLIFKNKWMPLIITATLFGAMHLVNPEVKAYGLGIMAVYYIGSGLVMGLLAIWDDGLEIPMGMHAATNIYAATLLTYEDAAIKTNALFKTTSMNVETGMYVFFGMSVLYMFILGKKYNWGNWRTLFNKINFENNTNDAA